MQSNTVPERPWLTADEGAAHVGAASRKSFYAWVKRHDVPVGHLGRRLRFRKADLDRKLGAKV